MILQTQGPADLDAVLSSLKATDESENDRRQGAERNSGPLRRSLSPQSPPFFFFPRAPPNFTTKSGILRKGGREVPAQQKGGCGDGPPKKPHKVSQATPTPESHPSVLGAQDQVLVYLPMLTIMPSGSTSR